MVVYKPIAGESPLWDFPHGTLAHREVAAYLVSQALGWDLVPHTWLRDGPLGEGMVQLWQEQDPAQSAVNLLVTDHVPETGWKHVLEGRDENGRMVALVHEDSPALRRMAVFDTVVNNAGRQRIAADGEQLALHGDVVVFMGGWFRGNPDAAGCSPRSCSQFCRLPSSL